MKNYNSSEIINVGSGEEISIKNLAYLIKDVIGYHGEITFDTSMPDGAPRKVLDGTKLKNLGWEAKTSLQEGIRKTYQWYLKACGNEIKQQDRNQKILTTEYTEHTENTSNKKWGLTK